MIGRRSLALAIVVGVVSKGEAHCGLLTSRSIWCGGLRRAPLAEPQHYRQAVAFQNVHGRSLPETMTREIVDSGTARCRRMDLKLFM